VTFDDTAVAQARTATDALRELEHSDWHLMADPALRRRWGVDLLAELADLAGALADAVETASGVSGLDVAGPAQQLCDAIRHRRDVLCADEDLDSPVLPAIAHDDSAGPHSPKHRAHRHLRPVR
jgi:hypothetical protein